MSGVEALAAVGLAGTIVQFTEIAAKAIKRLKEFEACAGKMPKSLQEIFNTLQLLITCITASETRGATPELMLVIGQCRDDVENLDVLLQKYLPKTGESRWRTRVKAWMSVRQEDEILKLKKKIDKHVPYLTYYETTRHAHAVPVRGGLSADRVKKIEAC